MAYIINDYPATFSKGEMYTDSDAGLNTSCTADTPTTLTNFSAGSLTDFTFATNELTYTGTATKTFLIKCSFAIDAPNNSNVYLRVAKNGTPEGKMQSLRAFGTGTDVGSITLSGLLSLATNDVVDIEVECDTTGDVASHYCNVSVIG